jgi:hypothetical protein
MTVEEIKTITAPVFLRHGVPTPLCSAAPRAVKIGQRVT